MAPEEVNGNYGFDPWIPAYSMARAQESDLMASYLEHLERVAAAETSLSGSGWRRESVERRVEKLQKDRERRQWRLSLSSHDINIRIQVERLAVSRSHRP